MGKLVDVCTPKSAKRGHTNVYLEAIWIDLNSGCAMIRICGGTNVSTVKELPPLALSESDWQKIGRFMDWKRK